MVKCSCGSTYFTISGRFTIVGSAFHCHEHFLSCCNCGSLYDINGEEIDLKEEIERQKAPEAE
ncbi:MAG: hypothetical protein HPY50_20245 [Firmicutes bacterium]|nr:hypothetical protein [Bacillota bacterium]